MKLFDWTARRAGGRITVTGKDEQGQDAKIVGVDTIEPHYGGRECVQATDRDGVTHELALPA
jgi:hypothetical protein